MGILSRILGVLLAIMVVVAIWQRGSMAKVARDRDGAVAAQLSAEAELKNVRATLATERQKVEKANQVAEEYERAKRDAESKGEAVAADLRAGTIRLQQRWAGCEARMSDLASGSSEPDAGADDRAASASRIVAAAAACDAQVRGLQAQVRADRE